MILAVLDANVLVSGFPGQHGAPAALIATWRDGRFQMIVSEPILDELAKAWQQPYWRSRISPRDAGAALALLRSKAIVSPVNIEVSGIATHPEDDLILATALSSGPISLSPVTASCRHSGTWSTSPFSPRACFSITSLLSRSHSEDRPALG